MSIEEMTHTAWRCRHSFFYLTGRGMQCHKCIGATPNDTLCGKCKKWQASELAENYFAGRLKGDLRAKTLTQIYLDRKKRGTF